MPGTANAFLFDGQAGLVGSGKQTLQPRTQAQEAGIGPIGEPAGGPEAEDPAEGTEGRQGTPDRGEGGAAREPAAVRQEHVESRQGRAAGQPGRDLALGQAADVQPVAIETRNVSPELYIQHSVLTLRIAAEDETAG